MGSSSEDGGAFAECFFAQYPLGMGRTPPSSIMVTSFAAAQQKQRRQQPLVTSASPSTQASHSGTLVVASSAGGFHSTGESPDQEQLAQITEDTREALEQVLRGRQAQDEDFSGRNVCRAKRKKPALEIMLCSDAGATGLHDPGIIVRSPTHATKGTVGTKTDDGGEGSSSSDMAVVPFSVSNWKNKRKLIIPLEQRLAQQASKHMGGDGGGISDHVMQLAVAMQQARKEVEAEQAAREAARQEEEELRQTEREAEATRRARELLERAAADIMQSSAQRKKESREERLERIRLERELREREKQQEGRQRRLAKAAARLGMTVEALEADAELLKTVDDAAAASGGGVLHNGSTADHAPLAMHTAAGKHGRSADERLPSLYTDDGVGKDSAQSSGGSTIRKGVFGSAVISNEGIRREMEALAKMEAQSGEVKDGIRLVDDGADGSSDDDDDDGGLGMDQLMRKKRKRRL